ncbi:Lysozyme C, partial [Varanus komodoensis]
MGWMRANKLKLNPDKTEVLLVGSSGFGEGELNLVLNGVALPPRDKVRSLGVLLDPEFSLEAQVTAAARSAFLQLRLILQLCPYLECDCLATVTHALVTSVTRSTYKETCSSFMTTITTKMKTPVFLFFLTGVVKTSAIIIDRCDLTAILKENDLEGFAGTTIAEWICLVFHSSGFNTAALNEGPEASNHGIFLLSSRWWCNDSKMPYARNYCNLSCEALQDDNITDDIECAKQVIQESNGFAAWRAWRQHCRGQDLRQYVEECEPEVTLTYGQPAPVTTAAADHRPNTTLSARNLTGTTFLTKGPLEPTNPLKAQANTTLPTKGPPAPPVTIKELLNSTLAENGLTKSTVFFNEPPNSTHPINAPPNSASPIKESANSSLPTTGPMNSTLPAGGPSNSTVLLKEHSEDEWPARAQPVGFQITDEFHHLIHCGEAGRVAGVEFVFGGHRQISHHHVEEKARANVDDCRRHGGVFGVLHEAQVRATQRGQHLPVSRERDLVQFSQELSQNTIQLVEVTNRFKELDLIDRVPEELWTKVHNIAQEVTTKPIPKKKKCKKAKWLSEEALQIAEERKEVKGKGERYTQLNAEFQRIARRDKNAFLNEQCKETEENNRIGRTRDLFKKIGDMKGTFHAKMGMIKDQNGRGPTEAEEIKKRWQDYTEELYKKELNVPDNHDVVVTDLKPDILECEVKWALGSLSNNKPSG